MYWQGWVRKVAMPNDVVVCKRGREWFYDDWCRTIIAIEHDEPVNEHGPACREFVSHLDAETTYRKPAENQVFREVQSAERNAVCVLHRWRPERNHFKDRRVEEYAPIERWAQANGLAFRVLTAELSIAESMAALSRAVAAVGPEGGGCKLAILAGTPLICWGLERERERLNDENIRDSKIVYLGCPRTPIANIVNILPSAIRLK